MVNPSGTLDKFRADYDMSRETRFIRRRLGLAPQGNSADWHYRLEQNYYRDIEKARDMDRNDAIVGQTINRAVNNIVQDGFTLDPKTGDKGLDSELKARFYNWAEDPEECDIAGEFTFHDYERHVMRSNLLDGDCVVLALETGQIQFIEAHEIQTHQVIENTVLGVTKDEFGKRHQYWIYHDPVRPFDTKPISRPVDARDSDGNRILFHIYNANRVSQTRGVTAFAPIFATAGMFEDIQFAKLVQQQIVSCFAIFREQAITNGGGLPTINESYGESTTETSAAGTRYLEGIAPGMEIIGRPGEKLNGFSPDVPNAEFFSHVKLMLQIIGVNLGLPLCLVLMDGSETNFSGWRGAVDEARKGWKENQRNLIKRFHCPLYRWKIRQWMQDDFKLRKMAQLKGVNIFAHKWNAPTWSYIDPVNDATGDILRMKNTLTSPRRLQAERGNDWEEIANEMVEDRAIAILAAKKKASEINEQYPTDKIDWRDLISISMPDGIQVSMQQTEDGAGQAQQPVQAGTSEMAGLTRQQWQRNRKAIDDILSEVIAGTMTNAKATVMLSGLGLSQQNVEALLQDAADGKIDSEPAEDPVDG